LVQEYPEQFEFIAFEPLAISSTQIRESIVNTGNSAQVTEQVLAFILSHGLYGCVKGKKS
jgi:nicotinic acid mononucleotide adenylyltransferase